MSGDVGATFSSIKKPNWPFFVWSRTRIQARPMLDGMGAGDERKRGLEMRDLEKASRESRKKTAVKKHKKRGRGVAR